MELISLMLMLMNTWRGRPAHKHYKY